MSQTFRCDCPITSAIDVLGDKWMLVIVKQMLMEGSKTFKDFTESSEAIATNILSTKLKLLEEGGLIIKSNHPQNKKTKLYFLSDKGLTLTAIIVELALWSDENLRERHPSMRRDPEMQLMKTDKLAFINTLNENHLIQRNSMLG